MAPFFRVRSGKMRCTACDEGVVFKIGCFNVLARMLGTGQLKKMPPGQLKKIKNV
jgi:hypothetical protein